MAHTPDSHDNWIVRAYDAHALELLRYAQMILADRSLAQDAVQQSFMRLLARGKPADILALKAFLRTVVRNECYRLLARRPRATITAEIPSLVEPLEASLERQEESSQLNRALRSLSPEQREVIHLKFYEQLTFAQIAELLAIPPNTAASRYRLALVRLRQLLPLSRIQP